MAGKVSGMDDWEMERDVRALARAHAIKKDPKHHAKVKAHAKKMKGEAERQKNENAAIVNMANSKK